MKSQNESIFDLTFCVTLLHIIDVIMYCNVVWIMKSIKKVGKYVVICLIGISLALIVALIQYDAKDLSASVLSITEKDFFESTQWWAGYKKDNQVFELFLSDQVRNESVLEVSILYNPSEVEWLLDDLKADCSVVDVKLDEWNLILEIDWYQDLDFDEWVFEIPYIWSSRDVTLEYVKWKSGMFSIWSLDNVSGESGH